MPPLAARLAFSFSPSPGQKNGDLLGISVQVRQADPQDFNVPGGQLLSNAQQSLALPNPPSHIEWEEPEPGSVTGGNGGGGTDLALEGEGDDLGLEGRR